MLPPALTNDKDVDELLSRPTPGALETLAQLDGDVLVLGVGGKMGPTLARMIRRGWDELGRKHKVVGVARFSNPAVEAQLQDVGVVPLRCDLLDRNAVQQLPDAPYIIFMAGQKFGTSTGPEFTWAMNTLVPAYVAEKFKHSRIVVFSTGCVYPFTPVLQGGSREEDTLSPPGDYANSCVGRERIFTYFSKQHSTPITLLRLNYAIDLRYGVLLDVAKQVWAGEPVDVSMGHVNVIWQGDANAQAIQCLSHAASPPFVLNITGPEIVSVRALAHRFGQLLEREPKITGTEGPTAWLNNASRAHQLFGYPTVSLEQMMVWVAEWVKQGGRILSKPTHFEARDGNF
ncbi:MAG: NAD(P)-dependent oxidoreductase [Abitibacteriaceae bacterium]|nr:NAD(P)-dependent oxidoreductase [Abditibacteriaceae bacterium]MBV9865626.1 NAD(P)-dependent oxidoreductase [Abditibacteriaceae bacterium]